VVVQRNRYLDQPLKEALLSCRGIAPHVFQDLMRVVEVAAVEPRNSAAESFTIHIMILTYLPA